MPLHDVGTQVCPQRRPSSTITTINANPQPRLPNTLPSFNNLMPLPQSLQFQPRPLLQMTLNLPLATNLANSRKFLS